MRKQKSIFQNIDWLLVLLYLVMVIAGWLNIFAAVYNEEHSVITDFSQNYGKQMMWILTSLVIAFFILIIDGKFYDAFAGVIYAISIISMIAVLFSVIQLQAASRGSALATLEFNLQSLQNLLRQ